MPPDSTENSQVEDVVMSLKLCARSQMERLQVLVDAATLAAEQIQDKRLELIEQGPDANIASEVFDILLLLVLDYPLGGRVLFAAAKKMLSGPLRWANVFLELGVKSSTSDLNGFVKGLSFAVSAANDAARTITYDKLKRYHAYAAAFVALGSEKDAEKNWAALAKAANRARSQASPPKPSLSAFDSPGVSLLSACLTYAMQQRYTISAQLALFENIVRSYPQAIPTVEKLILWDELTLEEITAIGSRTKLLFEAAIWAKLYGFDKEPPFEENRPVVAPGNMKINFVPDKLRTYWRDRFGDLVAEWARGPESRIPGDKPKGSLTSEIGARQAFLIDQYFVALARQFEKLSDEAFAISSPRQVQRARRA